MQIVTDSGTDLSLSPEQIAELEIHVVPLIVTLDGESYREGIDIDPQTFYRRLEASKGLPTTSQPAAGEFAELYRRLADHDPDILSIHMSSGLSGTFHSAQAGAKLAPEANVTLVDTKTLSGTAGWQVMAAVRARLAGWTKEQILPMLDRISAASDSLFTLRELKYLIHGGRISHMKGLIASALNIKPMIGVEKVGGTYEQRGQVRTFRRALQGLVKLIARQHPSGSELHVQVMHSQNPEGAEMLHDLLDAEFECTWRPTDQMSLVLGAHTGPSMVGVAYAPQAALAGLP
jgi:DegV family protein with EDD domain